MTPGSLTLAARGSLRRPRCGPFMRLRWRAVWLRAAGRAAASRGSFIAILVAMAVVPGPASAARPCTSRACQSAGVVRWARPLPGTWVAQAGLAGTTPAEGTSYAAMGAQVAAIGIGTTVFAYQSRSGAPAWESSLAGFRAGVPDRVGPGLAGRGHRRGRRAGQAGRGRPAPGTRWCWTAPPGG